MSAAVGEMTDGDLMAVLETTDACLHGLKGFDAFVKSLHISRFARAVSAIKTIIAERDALRGEVERLRVERDAFRDALRKVAGFEGNYTMPYPESYEGYGSYAVITTREALALAEQEQTAGERA